MMRLSSGPRYTQPVPSISPCFDSVHLHAKMLSILPFEHSKDPERPFKAYSRPSSLSSSGSPYYSSYPQNSYLSYSGSLDRRDTMDLPVRPPPAHMYDQMSSHHLMDMSQRHGMQHSGLKSDPDNANLHYGSMSHMSSSHSAAMSQGLHGYGDMPPQPSGPAMHNMPPQISNGNHSNRVTNSMSPTEEKISPNSDAMCGDARTPQEPGSTTTTSSAGTTNNIITSKMPPKKRPLSVPESLKDDTYWEKRKKNNESAKRSREQRRMKEEQIAMRVVYLEQENLQLRTEVSLLKAEIEKLRCMLYNS